MTASSDTRAGVRLAAGAALLLAALAVAWVLLGGGDREQTLRAQFHNAGRLVEGGEVQVAGRKVGQIEGVDLTDDGLAEIELAIDDDSILPLRRGTRAQIRAVGAGTLANNFVELRPGSPAARALPDGAVLSTRQTTGIVDVDALLSSFDESAREDVRELISNSAAVFAGSGARYLNGMLAKLDPALAHLHLLNADLGSDRAQLGRLITAAERTATALASRRQDLAGAVADTARGLGAIAAERRALTGILDRAPGALAQGTETLRSLDTTARAVRPALRAAAPVGGPADDLLTRMISALPRAERLLAQVDRQLPDVRRSLDSFRPLADSAPRALATTGDALAAGREIVRATRIYAPEIFIGIFNGLITIATGNHRPSGHYIHLAFSEPPQTLLAGPAAELLPLSKFDLVPELFGVRTGLTSRCPGANAPPAPDGSSPVHEHPELCDPRQSMPPSVNQP